jgi:hypothetical protein
VQTRQLSAISRQPDKLLFEERLFYEQVETAHQPRLLHSRKTAFSSLLRAHRTARPGGLNVGSVPSLMVSAKETAHRAVD